MKEKKKDREGEWHIMMGFIFIFFQGLNINN